MGREETLADLVCQASSFIPLWNKQTKCNHLGLLRYFPFSSLLLEVKAFVQKAMLSLPVFSLSRRALFSFPFSCFAQPVSSMSACNTLFQETSRALSV